MESRFTFKDFVFVVLFVVVIGAVVWASWQFSYQEQRLNDVKAALGQLDQTQKQQLGVLSDIRNALKSGVTIGRGGPENGVAGTQEARGRIRRKTEDGGIYVYYPEAPLMPRDPVNQPDYATGDWVVQDLGTEPKVLTPYCTKDYSGQLAQVPVLESMTSMNPETFELEPYLAESYTVSGDGLTIRFTLRSNICFSDGHPITTDDVMFSYNTVMNPVVDCAPLRSYFSNVESAKAIDERTVEFKMKEPYFLAVDYIGGMSIIPKHIYNYKDPEEYNRMGGVLVASGPYRVEKWDRGQQIVMVRNDKYWGERPTFDRVVFKFISNEQAGFQAFQNGEIDRFEPDGEQYAQFSKDESFLKKFKAYKYLRVNSGYGFVGYNERRPMFKDKETRRALGMLIDTQAVCLNLLKGMGFPTAGPFREIGPQANTALKPLAYDPEGAKKLLAQAGWKPGTDGVLARDGVKFEFDLTTGAGSPMVDRLSNYLKNQFESAGIRMRITPWEFAVMQKRIDDRDFDAVFMSWMGSGPEDDPTQIWHSKSMENKGSNFIGFNNKESDQLLEEARTTMDREKRLALWHKWETLIVEEQPYTFMYSRPDRMFVNGRMKNTDPYKLDVYPLDWYVPTAAQKYK